MIYLKAISINKCLSETVLLMEQGELRLTMKPLNLKLDDATLFMNSFVRIKMRSLIPAQRLTCTALACAMCLASTAWADPLTKTFSKNEVTLKLTVDPPSVDLAADNEVSLVLNAPEGISAKIPPDISDRFDGFTLAGSFTTGGGSDAISGTTYHYRIVPIAGAKAYRIKPIPVSIEDTSSHPPISSWFPTEMVTIEGPTSADGQPTSVSTDLKNKYIRPSFKDVPKYIGLTTLGLLVIALLVYIISIIKLHRKIRRMTPSERALRELILLIGRKLPEKGLFKDFYIELTMVVRRYIERRYGIRAPEQTTEEFLAAAADHSEFDSTSIAELKNFLTAADLIKFAGVEASVSSAAEATTKAKSYIEIDALTTPLHTRKESAR